MEIKIKEAAQTYLANKITKDELVLLALDDGSNKFSNMGGSCTIGAKFQLVLVDQPENGYDQALTNEQGLHFFTGKPELMYLTDGLALDFHNGFLILRDNSGILDSAVSITRYQAPTTAELKEKMMTDGVKNC
ncbi:iron-sulfur cluster biosynthesis family protein [Lapidilactobacillus salsurivasis]